MQRQLDKANKNAEQLEKAEREAQEVNGSMKALKEQLSEQNQKLDTQEAQAQKASSLQTELADIKKQLSEQTQKLESHQAQTKDSSSLQSQLDEATEQLSAMKKTAAEQEQQASARFAKVGFDCHASSSSLSGAVELAVQCICANLLWACTSMTPSADVCTKVCTTCWQRDEGYISWLLSPGVGTCVQIQTPHVV